METNEETTTGGGEGLLHSACTQLFNSNLELLDAHQDVLDILETVIRRTEDGDVTGPLAKAVSRLVLARARAKGEL